MDNKNLNQELENLSKNDFNQDLDAGVEKDSKKILIISGLAIVLIIGVGIFVWLNHIQQTKNTNKLVLENNIKSAVVKYAKIQNAVAAVLEDKTALDIGSSANKQPSFIFSSVLAAEESENLSESEIIAKAISPFFEIGRTKDIKIARDINLEDIDSINTAQDRLHVLIQETGKIKDEVVQDQNTVIIIDNLLYFYNKIDSFLKELLFYKDFNGSMLSVIKIDEIAGSAEKLIELSHQTLDFPRKFVEEPGYEITFLSQYREILADLIPACEDSARQLKDVRVDNNLKDFEQIKKLQGLYIQKYELSAIEYKRQLDAINTKGDISALSETNPSLFEAETKMFDALYKIRDDSELAKLFESIIASDKKIQEDLVLYKEQYNLDFPNLKNLEDLINYFKRKEKGELLGKLADLEAKLKQYNQEGETTKTFSVDSTVHKMFVSLTSSLPNEQINFRLNSPTDKLIDKTAIGSEINYFERTDKNQVYFINEPEKGIWETFASGPIGANIEIQIYTDLDRK